MEGMVPAIPGVLQLLLAHNWFVGRMMSLASQSQGDNRGPSTHPTASPRLNSPIQHSVMPPPPL